MANQITPKKKTLKRCIVEFSKIIEADEASEPDENCVGVYCSVAIRFPVVSSAGDTLPDKASTVCYLQTPGIYGIPVESDPSVAESHYQNELKIAKEMLNLLITRGYEVMKAG